MTNNLKSFNKFAFSLFKSKCIPLQNEKFTSLVHLYQELSFFQKNLAELQQKKLPKKLQDFQKKFRKLYKSDNLLLPSVPMQLNHTYQFFCRRIDNILFGNQQQQIETSLETLVSLTRNMSEHCLNVYFQDLMPKVHQKLSLYQALNQRFTKIEERLSRILFKGYTGFSQLSSKLSFLNERQYKGDFKFVLKDDLETLEIASESMYHCALFNQIRSKLSLVCELAVTQYCEKLSPQALSRFIFGLAVAGKPLKLITNNFLNISDKIKEFPIEILFYMCIIDFEDAVLVKHITDSLVIQPKNISQQLLSNILSSRLQRKYNITLNILNNPQFNRPAQINGGQQFFQNFLKRYQYTYSFSTSNAIQNKLYQIQNKKFICLDHGLVNYQNLQLNGLGYLYKQHFAEQNLQLKHINWPRMLQMEKRTEKDQYVLSKFKGIEKPKIVKNRFYD